jgi:hypothetical protein
VSNALAIATVTATLRGFLQSALNNAPVGKVGSADVRPMRPGSPSPLTKGVGLFLYQVTHNSHWRNSDLPTRDQTGLVVRQRPRVALDLHYLLSFHGEDETYEPERLLAIVESALHASPVLPRALVQQTIDANAELAESDLADQIDTVRLTPVPLNLEELSKLWSVFFQTTYVISVAYVASVVLIEEPLLVRAAPLVQTRHVYATTLRRPVLTGAAAQIVEPGEPLVLLGHSLAAANVRVRIDSSAPIAAADVTDSRVQVSLPADLSAGLHLARVQQDREIGGPDPVRVSTVESNAVPFMLVPQLDPDAAHPLDPVAVARGDAAELLVRPVIRAGQRIRVLVGDFGIDVPPLESDGDGTLAFAVPDTAPLGTFPLRVEVDGAMSLIEPRDEAPGYRPAIEVTAA